MKSSTQLKSVPPATHQEEKQAKRSLIFRVLATTFVLVGLALVWSQTPLREYVHPKQMFFWMRDVARENSFAFLLFAVVIGVGNLFLIPINLLLIAVAMVYPGWKGFWCGMAGAVIAALLQYGVGRKLGALRARAVFGEKYDKVAEQMDRHGFWAMAIMSIVPVAPNIVTNMVAGVCQMPLSKLIMGTIVGFLPGLAIINLLGKEMREFIADPSLGAALGGVGLVILLALITIFSQRLKQKVDAFHGGSSHSSRRS